MKTLDRFLKYVSIDTTSNPKSDEYPSSQDQKRLAYFLCKELKKLKIDYYYDSELCYVYAKLKGNIKTPKIGFVSHLDTSPDAKGTDIKPQVIRNYDAKDVWLNDQTILSTAMYPDLLNHKGKTLITTDGTTLLGADDKAGITEIMNMLEYYVCNNIPHGDIYVCFTPDEEIGLGLEHFNKNRFPADYAVTVDGSSLGEISYENFNAATAKITINGVSTHCGYAKDKMVNALLVANEINNMLPNEIPSNTEGYEGFYHLEMQQGSIEKAMMEYLIRDFDELNFEMRKKKLELIVEELNKKYNNGISINITNSYSNMKKIFELDQNKEFIEHIINATKNADVEPLIIPTRGGTDGTELSFMGIPCPNIGTGGHNFHSIYEYICVEDMQKVSNILINMVQEVSGPKRIRK